MARKKEESKEEKERKEEMSGTMKGMKPFSSGAGSVSSTVSSTSSAPSSSSSESSPSSSAPSATSVSSSYLIAQIRAFCVTLAETTPLWNSLLISLGFVALSLLFPFYDIVLIPLAVVIFVIAWHNPIIGTIVSFVLMLPAIAWQTPIFAWIFLLVIAFMLFNVFKRWYMFSAAVAIVGLSFVGMQFMPDVKMLTGIAVVPLIALSVMKLGSKRSVFFVPLTIFLILVLSVLWGASAAAAGGMSGGSSIGSVGGVGWSLAGGLGGATGDGAVNGAFLTVSERSLVRADGGIFYPSRPSPLVLELPIAVGEAIARMFSWDVMQGVGGGLNALISALLAFFFTDSGLVQLIGWTLVFYGVAWLPLFLKGGKWQQGIPSLCVLALIPIHFLSAFISGVAPDFFIIPSVVITVALAFSLDALNIRITAEEEVVAEEKRGLFGLPGIVDLSVQKGGPSSLAEIGDYDATKKELKESILMPLRNRELTLLYGIRPPKGILLFGPPGCGKTLLMSALAKELHIPFYYVKCSELLSKWLGESEKNIAELFKNARKNQPCILFIDEIDALAKKRELMAADDPMARVLSSMLTEMDGIKSNENVIVVGATNIPAVLDPAILRPGRFDKIIYMPAPDASGRKEILKLYLKRLPLAPDVDIDRLAKLTERYTGADIANLTIEAARRAAPEAVESGKVVPIKMEHFLTVLKSIKPSVTFDMLDEYERFRIDFERRGVPVAEEAAVSATPVTWDDVVDLEDVKQTLREAIELPLFHEEELAKYKVKPAKGILLFGPPGCGKTLIARAASNELKATFISLTPADISRRGYDEAVSLIKETFNRARENAPAIVFIDEVESIAPSRDYTTSKVMEDIVAQLLIELDGLRELKNVILIGATNRPDIIDKALLRPGRFDRIVFVGPPNREGRAEIFAHNLEGIRGASAVDYEKLAEESEGFTGADISGVCQEVKLQLVRKKIAGEPEPEVTTEQILDVLKQRTPSVTVKMLKDYLTFVKEFGERR